jgi:hypothetical protein
MTAQKEEPMTKTPVIECCASKSCAHGCSESDRCSFCCGRGECAATLSETTVLVVLRRALSVLTLDASIRQFLIDNDPKALKQAERALSCSRWTFERLSSEHAALVVAHETAKQADAGFDAGEFSGPEHDHQFLRDYEELLQRAGWSDVEFEHHLDDGPSH